jgi:toxin ParE1/3/4
MAKLIWAEKAISSLEDIYDYIVADSPFYARFQVERIFEAVERLKQFPESGRKLPELPHLPHREIIVDAYRIIYRFNIKQNSVIIINTVHGRQLLTKPMTSENQ